MTDTLWSRHKPKIIITPVITVGTLRCESGDTSKNVTGKLRVLLLKFSDYSNSFSVLIRSIKLIWSSGRSRSQENFKFGHFTT